MNEDFLNINNEKVSEFLNDLASTSPVPSGGAAIGLTGAISAALSEMLCNLSILNKKYENFKEVNQNLAELCLNTREAYLKSVQMDSLAFLMLKETYKLPESSKEEISIKEKRLKEDTIRANDTPIEVIYLASKMAPTLEILIKTSVKTAKSDIGVCASLLEATVKSSWLTILINKKFLDREDSTYKEKIEEVKKLKDSTLQKLKAIYTSIEQDLK